MRHVAVLALLAFGSVAHAQVAVVPAQFTSTEGDSSYFLNAPGQVTYQQVFAPSTLTSLPTNVLITGFRFRVQGGQPSGPDVAYNFANFDVRIGQSLNPPGFLSNVVASNFGPDTIVARTGALTWPVGSFPGGLSPNAFGPLIDFQSPYSYSTGSNLLVTVSHTSGGGSDFRLDAHSYPSSMTTQAQYRQELAYNSPTTSMSFNFALIMQFQYTPVPEPSALLLAGLAAVAAVRRIRGRKLSRDS